MIRCFLMREARFAFEASSGQAIDMPDIDGLTRNEALFESAVPLASCKFVYHGNCYRLFSTI